MNLHIRVSFWPEEFEESNLTPINSSPFYNHIKNFFDKEINDPVIKKEIFTTIFPESNPNWSKTSAQEWFDIKRNYPEIWENKIILPFIARSFILEENNIFKIPGINQIQFNKSSVTFLLNASEIVSINDLEYDISKIKINRKESLRISLEPNNQFIFNQQIINSPLWIDISIN